VPESPKKLGPDASTSFLQATATLVAGSVADVHRGRCRSSQVGCRYFANRGGPIGRRGFGARAKSLRSVDSSSGKKRAGSVRSRGPCVKARRENPAVLGGAGRGAQARRYSPSTRAKKITGKTGSGLLWPGGGGAVQQAGCPPRTDHGPGSQSCPRRVDPGRGGRGGRVGESSQKRGTLGRWGVRRSRAPEPIRFIGGAGSGSGLHGTGRSLDGPTAVSGPPADYRGLKAAAKLDGIHRGENKLRKKHGKTPCQKTGLPGLR